MPTVPASLAQPVVPITGRQAESVANLNELWETISRLERRLAELEEIARLRRAHTPSRELHIDY